MSRNRLPLVVAGVAGLILVLLLRSLFTDGDGGSDGSAAPSGPREGCIGLNLTASSEKAGLLGEIAQEYANAGRSVDGKCVDVVVSTKASGGAEEALDSGWGEGIGGPRPEVWVPAGRNRPALVGEALPR